MYGRDFSGLQMSKLQRQCAQHCMVQLLAKKVGVMLGVLITRK